MGGAAVAVIRVRFPLLSGLKIFKIKEEGERILE